MDVPDSASPGVNKLCPPCEAWVLQLSTLTDSLIKDESSTRPEDRDLGSRLWAELKEGPTCSLCELIVHAVEDTTRRWQRNETPHSCTFNLTVQTVTNSGASADRLPSLDIVAKYPSSESDKLSLLPARSDRCKGPQFVGRQIKSDRINPAQINAWIRQCGQEHGDACHFQESLSTTMVRSNLLVIDVHDMCLTVLPRDGRYLALSYVWGGVNQPQTMLANVENLKKPRGLAAISSLLPKSAIDAMALVDMLGERYLWIDTLCIVQDDQRTKSRMLNRMHQIYRCAHLTIIAATGMDANAGLPGVSSPRGLSQPVAHLPSGISLLFPMHYLGIQESTWASRGWTYQEYFFAKRRLIFYGGQVVFQCNTRRWREDIVQEHLEQGLTLYQLFIGGDRMRWEPFEKWTRHSYKDYVETYIDRNLGRQGDILDAFTGITREVTANGLATHFGLLVDYFAIDLLWKPCRWVTRRPGLPSWSWAGWQGPVVVANTYPECSDPTEWMESFSWIDFYSFNSKDGEFHPLVRRKAKTKGGLRLPELPASDPRKASKTTEIDRDRAFVSVRDVLTPLFARLSIITEQNADSVTRLRQIEQFQGTNIIDSGTILFRTMTGTVNISVWTPKGRLATAPPRQDPFLPSSPSLYLYTQSGSHIGTAWVHTEEMYSNMKEDSKSPGRSFGIEIAVIAGPLKPDWRTRSERPSQREIMDACVDAGHNARDIIAREMPKGVYYTKLGEIFLVMLQEQHAEIYETVPIEKLPLDQAFWDEFNRRAQELNLAMHNDENFEAYRSIMMDSNAATHEDARVSFFRVLLVGQLGHQADRDKGTPVEVIGSGEVREDALGMIEGLQFCEVVLK